MWRSRQILAALVVGIGLLVFDGLHGAVAQALLPSCGRTFQLEGNARLSSARRPCSPVVAAVGASRQPGWGREMQGSAGAGTPSISLTSPIDGQTLRWRKGQAVVISFHITISNYEECFPGSDNPPHLPAAILLQDSGLKPPGSPGGYLRAGGPYTGHLIESDEISDSFSYQIQFHAASDSSNSTLPWDDFIAKAACNAGPPGTALYSNYVAFHQRAPVHHYKIELRMWIPQHEVVDPTALANGLHNRSVFHCDHPEFPTDTYSIEWGAFHGDGHAGYDPPHVRAQVGAEFDWDGDKITDLVKDENTFGESVRIWHYRYQLPHQHSWHEFSCVGESARATKKATATASGKDFKLAIDSSIPLVRAAPSIDGTLTGALQDDGSINISVVMTRMPSSGFRAWTDGKLITTHIINDVSHLDLSPGLRAAAEVFRRLITHTDSQHIHIPPPD
jgi:hypothetical protein